VLDRDIITIYLKAAVAMTLGVYTSRTFVDCIFFKWDVLQFCALISPSAIAELLVNRSVCSKYCIFHNVCVFNSTEKFLPRDAMLSAVYAVVVCLSVCLFVCVCVCLSHSGIVSKRLNVGSCK